VSAAGTVVATSAEGAGDMPSSAPVASEGASPDGAQPFSEVLSRSAADPPVSSSSAPPPPPSVDRDEVPAQTDTVATPGRAVPGRDPAGPSGTRGHRRAGHSGPGPRTAPSPDGPLAAPPSTNEGVPIPPPGSTPVPDATTASDAAQSQGAPLPPAALAAPAWPTTVVAPAASAGPAQSRAATATPDGHDVAPTAAQGQEDGAGSTMVAGWSTQFRDAAGTGSIQDGGPGSDAPGGRTPAVTGVAGADVRAPENHPVPTGSTALAAGPVRVQATASPSGGAASVLTAGTPANPDTAAGATEEALGLAEFPDGGGGTAGASLDVSDLAASISRPLAGGSGDYSVQVSLHPPELGEVRALLSLQGDVLHVTLTPEHSGGFDALSDAMPALHEQLAGGGVEVNVTLGHPGDPQGTDGRGPADTGPSGGASPDGPDSAATSPASPMTDAGPGRIHLVL
jgi:hypothetical protein